MSMAPCSHPPSPFHSPPLCAELGLQFWEDQICPADSELLTAATYLVAVPKQNPPSEPQSQVPVGPSVDLCLGQTGVVGPLLEL